MQFLFGMMMIELVVQITLGLARAHLWLAKWTLRTSWRALRAAYRQARVAVDMYHSNRAFRSAAARRGERHD